MNFIDLPLKGAFVIELEPFMDNRGMFTRLFCKKELEKVNLKKDIVQINYSLTKKKGTIRGLHYQLPPNAEIKMVKALKGTIFDVIVDIRRDSPTFLKWHGEILSQENMRIMYVPEGFAHGFQTLEDNCELLYLHTERYVPGSEGALHVQDPRIGIVWPLPIVELSERDRAYPFIDMQFNGVLI